MEEGAARGRSVSRLNVLIAITAAIIGLIYGYDLGSIASALLFLVPAFDLNTFMTSVVTSAVVLGQLFGRSLLGASPTPSGASLDFHGCLRVGSSAVAGLSYERILVKALHGIPPPGVSTGDGFWAIRNCFSYSTSL